jgi:hypothetical protein
MHSRRNIDVVDVPSLHKCAKVWYTYILGSCGVHSRRNIDVVDVPSLQKCAKVWYSYILGSCGVHSRNLDVVMHSSRNGPKF